MSEFRHNNDGKTDRLQFKGGPGCTVAILIWLALMALACLGWFGGQVYQVWTGAGN